MAEQEILAYYEMLIMYYSVLLCHAVLVLPNLLWNCITNERILRPTGISEYGSVVYLICDNCLSSLLLFGELKRTVVTGVHITGNDNDTVDNTLVG